MHWTEAGLIFPNASAPLMSVTPPLTQPDCQCAGLEKTGKSSCLACCSGTPCSEQGSTNPSFSTHICSQCRMECTRNPTLGFQIASLLQGKRRLQPESRLFQMQPQIDSLRRFPGSNGSIDGSYLPRSARCMHALSREGAEDVSCCPRSHQTRGRRPPGCFGSDF